MIGFISALAILLFSTMSFGQISVEKPHAFTQRGLHKHVHGPAGIGPIGPQLEYRPELRLEQNPSADEIKLKPVLEKGQRAVEWLNLVNSQRDPSQRLNIADKNSSNPVPIEKPNIISVTTILEKFNKTKSELPVEMTSVIFENKDLTSIPPLKDEEFLKYIREMNKSYQAAVRWVGQAPYFDYYAQASIYDIRGHYFLSQEKNLFSQLADFSSLPVEKKLQFKEWLLGICHNSQIQKRLCEDELNIRIQNNQLNRFHSKYKARAKKTYDEFFRLEAIRKELKWNANKTVLTQEFIQPSIQKVTDWLKTHVEDEWKGSGFSLLLSFIPDNGFSPFIAFEKGVTPNVSNGNKITMDPDYSLDDYDTQWTIRHEFGHILGFPDCYLEFYDKADKSMTYYTIETDNLMCAWGGKLKPKHIEDLRRVYR